MGVLVMFTSYPNSYGNAYNFSRMDHPIDRRVPYEISC